MSTPLSDRTPTQRQLRQGLLDLVLDGTTAMAFEPVDFMAKLAALVPRPRHNTLRFHGVYAPNARLRSQVVDQMAAPERQPCSCGSGGAEPQDQQALLAPTHLARVLSGRLHDNPGSLKPASGRIRPAPNGLPATKIRLTSASSLLPPPSDHLVPLRGTSRQAPTSHPSTEPAV